jgi:hypothetical protein
MYDRVKEEMTKKFTEEEWKGSQVWSEILLNNKKGNEKKKFEQGIPN